jgi:hypothetical protein
VPSIRTNKPPATSTFYERNVGGNPVWKTVGPQPGFDIKVRTVDAGGSSQFWSIEARIPITTPWLTLQPQFGLFFDIGQVFTAGGIENVAQFPWPFDPDNPTGNILADPLSTLTENWDPTTLGKGFLLNFGDANPAKGVRFKQGIAGIGVLDGGGNVTGSANLAVGASNNFVAQLQNTAPNVAQKVRAKFRIAEFGIVGGLYGNNPNLLALWEELPTDPNTNPAPHDGLDILTTPGPLDHTDIVLNWTVDQQDHDKFVGLWDDQCLWVQLDSIAGPGSGTAFAQESVRRNLHLVGLSKAELPAVVNALAFGRPRMRGRHELLLHVTRTVVPPTKPGPTPLEILYGLGNGEDGGGVIEVARGGRPPDLPLLEDNPLTNGTTGVEDKEPTATWHTVVHCYERTPETLTFSRRKRRHVVVYVGSYAFVGRHPLRKGETHESVTIRHDLAPLDGKARLRSLGRDFYRLTLGPKDRVALVNHLEVRPVHCRPDDGDDDDDDDDDDRDRDRD